MKKRNNPKSSPRSSRNKSADSTESEPFSDEVKGLMMECFGDMMLDSPFDIEERVSASKLKTTRGLLRKAAEGDLAPWQSHVRQAGEGLALNLKEYELCMLVWHCSQANKEAWKAMVPLVQSDNPLCAALGLRALIKAHPNGIEEGAKEALAAIRRRFDYLNLADNSPEENKIRSAGWMLRAMLLLGAEELLPWAKELGALLPADVVKASFLDPLAGGDEPSAPANTLTVLFCFSRLGALTERAEDYEAFGVTLVTMPILNKDFPCLERYRYSLGAVAPTLEFVSYPEWSKANSKLLDDLAYREAGEPDETVISVIRESWLSRKRNKPSTKQVARQHLLNMANDCGIKQTKDFPFEW